MWASLGIENFKVSQPPKFYFTICGNKLNCKIKFWFKAVGLPSLRLQNPHVV